MDFQFTFLSHRKTSDSHLILEDFYKNIIKLRNCARNHHSISYVESPIFEETDHLCSYKNLANQAFSKKASGISSIGPLGNKVSTAIKCSVSRSDN